MRCSLHVLQHVLVKRQSSIAELRAFRSVLIYTHVLYCIAAFSLHDLAHGLQVLSHPARRAIYDQYGERGLKEGVPDGQVRCGVPCAKYLHSARTRCVWLPIVSHMCLSANKALVASRVESRAAFIVTA